MRQVEENVANDDAVLLLGHALRVKAEREYKNIFLIKVFSKTWTSHRSITITDAGLHVVIELVGEHIYTLHNNPVCVCFCTQDS